MHCVEGAPALVTPGAKTGIASPGILIVRQSFSAVAIVDVVDLELHDSVLSVTVTFHRPTIASLSGRWELLVLPEPWRKGSKFSPIMSSGPKQGSAANKGFIHVVFWHVFFRG